MRGEWIEIALVRPDKSTFIASLPMRGEWIEMSSKISEFISSKVSPRSGRVD